jgi:hypothetical protein
LTQCGKTIHAEFPSPGNGYIYEINEVNRCIASGKKESELWSHNDALELGRMVEEVFDKIRQK